MDRKKNDQILKKELAKFYKMFDKDDFTEKVNKINASMFITITDQNM
jgi:hypothetical protein